MKTFASLLIVVILLALAVPMAAQDSLTLEVLGSYSHGAFDEGAAEIAAFHAPSATLYVVNGDSDTIDLLDISDPAAIALKSQIDVTAYGDSAQSVAVSGDVVAVAIAADPAQDPGFVVFFDVDGNFTSSVTVGALPDMVTFTPDGTKALSANEGEPDDDYVIDPVGSVSIIDLSGGVENLTDDAVTTIDFEGVEIPEDVRIFGPGATPAQDLEPEYIAVSPDGSTAYVTLQENNAVGVIDIESASAVAVVALGFKDHSLPGNELDAGKDDGMVNIANWPLFGMYQPDAIAAYEVDGEVYLVTANEGDARDYDGYSEEGEIGETEIDPDFPGLDDLLTEETILGFEIVNSLGDTDGDGDLDELYANGARSFSIWNSAGELVSDSGSDFERITGELYPDDFNSSNDENGDLDGRSDNKGPEPEGVVLGEIDGATYAFVCLERIGGVMVYDISDPMAPVYVTYVNNRDFSGDAEAGTAGDLGPEGLVFISADDSPTGGNLLVVTNEVSGTTTIFAVN
ncbi:MAG: alkaline phosphatase [Chloroflexi bacterium]|nr:alkaline phosphatase [Chloroflexota bacterium]